MSRFFLLALLLLNLTPTDGSAAQQQILEDPDIEEAIELATEARYAQALELFASKLRKHPESALLNYYVGLTHLYLGHKKLAVEHLEKSLAEEAPFPQAYYWCAQAHLACDELEEAARILERGLEQYPRNEKLLDLNEEVRQAIGS